MGPKGENIFIKKGARNGKGEESGKDHGGPWRGRIKPYFRTCDRRTQTEN